MGKKVAFVSLGCDKNTVDSEIMLTLLMEHGYEITKQDEEADVIVINTCAFILDAQEESINTIIEMGQYKESGKCKALIVTGCLAQRYADEIFNELPEVDAVVGTASYERIVEVMEDLLNQHKKQIRCTDVLEERDLSYYRRTITTPGYFEYLKIAEGCDNRCTYCIIPQLRGAYRSRRKEDILQEARDLAGEGVKELMVVAQDTTRYGRDLGEGYELPQLLHDLCKVEGIRWIRLLYCYPEEITDELIETMRTEKKILPYIDMPIQHCSNTVLKRMGRRHTKETLIRVMGKLREAMPDIAIRTTLITGFPGETEGEFQEAMDFVRESRFDRLGVFTYSQEDGTPAAKLPDQVDEDEKRRRQAELMTLQKEISEDVSAQMVGRELVAIIEGRIPGEGDDEGEVYSARTYRDAPDIDGFIFITASEELRSGDLVRCRVTGAYEYDLIGELL